MKFAAATIVASALLLRSQVAANPIQKRDIPSSFYTDMAINGSICSFADDASCNEIFYTAGSCGLSTYFTSEIPSSSTIPLVAMASAVMSQFGYSQNNELCGKTIEITGANGVVQRAAIADTAGADIIDMCLNLWEDFGGVNGDGTIMTGTNSLKWHLVE
ncbi:hypothetical protein TMatcc_001182 [Talaromyces marneffei ATCC 18224]|uniref:Ecp2 effector protein domain-containing protein n=2 Tax=Talaromyces marneffei TaxID=37727 RepID=B6QNV4_TALMQ|nr:uncharacterized protein EYB26_003722 [Talaromyces marneffei]EEA21180.1 hypothetical protein PMAA_049780 [Talaromyces marneffei ATCC 18224]KAE8550109.1 hypothetical protein EYB25_008640 [Talaromyces marneffei]QGA16055.1 hypothetical protein EYB26_003722 [Talaromyces marneffei]